MQLIKNRETVLQEMRLNSESTFTELFEEAAKWAKRIGTVLEKPRIPARSRCRDTAASDENAEFYYKVNVFIPVVDAVLTDFSERFNKHFELVAGLDAFIPSLCKA